MQYLIRQGFLAPKKVVVVVQLSPEVKVEVQEPVLIVKPSDKYTHKLVLPMTPGMSYAEYLLRVCKIDSESRRFHSLIQAKLMRRDKET